MLHCPDEVRGTPDESLQFLFVDNPTSSIILLKVRSNLIFMGRRAAHLDKPVERFDRFLSQ